MKIIVIWREIKGVVIIEKVSGNNISLKIGCLKFLVSFSFLKAKLEELSTTVASFPTLDANRLKDELFQKQTEPTHMKTFKLLNHFMNLQT